MRYEVVGNESGVFVLDRQTTLLHHCDKQKCNVVTPEGVSVEALKLIAGGPKAAEAAKQDGKCPCDSKPKEAVVRGLKATSFDSLDKPIPPLNEIKEELGMGAVTQSAAKPSDPFAGGTTDSSASSSSSTQNVTQSASSGYSSSTPSSYPSSPSNSQTADASSTSASISSSATPPSTSSTPSSTSPSADTSYSSSAATTAPSPSGSAPSNPYGSTP